MRSIDLKEIDLGNVLPETELRIVGFEVTPRSIASGACTGSAEGPHMLKTDYPIQFTYNVTIEHSKDDWPNRLDHYFNFGSNKLYWEQLVASFTVLMIATLLFGCVLSSALNKDNDMIKYLRKHYRTSRFNTANSKFLSSGPGYAPVG